MVTSAIEGEVEMAGAQEATPTGAPGPPGVIGELDQFPEVVVFLGSK